MAKNLKTTWVCVATSGQTADGSGRIIEKEWLEDMAEHYDPRLYTAMIWPDHQRWFGNGGKVVALKIEKATVKGLEDQIQLFAILQPNDYLIRANKEGKFIFSSIEVKKNFMDKGHFYLDALGVTDEPASAGTDELKFNKLSQQKDKIFIEGGEINVFESLEEKGNIFKSLFSKYTQPEAENDDMTKEQLEELKKHVDTSIDARFSVIQETVQANFKDKEGDESPKKETLEMKFSKLVTSTNELVESNKKLQENFDAMNTEFKALKGNPAGDESDGGNGEGGDPEFTPVY